MSFQKVFETDNKENGWDGNFKGRSQDMGVYIWLIKAFDYDGNSVLQNGNVSLMR